MTPQTTILNSTIQWHPFDVFHV